MTKSSFKSKTHTSKRILEIVHTHLCGPIDVKSYKGEKYIILFVDHYSRMMTVLFLKQNVMLFKCLNGIWQELKK